MGNYFIIFRKILVDGLPPSIKEGRMVSFEISGEGSIPRVLVEQPKIVDKNKNPLLAFKRTLVDKTDVMQV